MKRATILREVKERFGFTTDLVKYDGVWYWSVFMKNDADVEYVLDETCTHTCSLNHMTLGQWMNEFEYKMLEADVA